MKAKWVFENEVNYNLQEIETLMFSIHTGKLEANDLPLILKKYNEICTISKEGNKFTATFNYGNKIYITTETNNHQLIVQGEWWYKGVYTFIPYGQSTKIRLEIFNDAKKFHWLASLMILPEKQKHKLEFDKLISDIMSYKEIGTNIKGATPFARTYFHGTKADLKIGDFIEVGYNSNYGQQKNAKYIFLTATLDAAIWGAELALGEGRERIYLVEPTGELEDDPDLTDKKFPGNPTQSFRSTKPFRVVGEVTVWQGHSAEQIRAMKERLEKLKEQGIHSLNDA